MPGTQSSFILQGRDVETVEHILERSTSFTGLQGVR